MSVPNNITSLSKLGPIDPVLIIDSTQEFYANSKEFYANFGTIDQLFKPHSVDKKVMGINSPLVIETEESKRIESSETPNTFTKPPF